ncbi:predicted protein [Naegleria gruberi]|uniref:Predicted protein n=1 Tax=Naegleria gruberi TaxID=5762 RepID=D2V3R4_NAEGR|nr:uncharacterized protein NAEGRDRAFT_63461 [Naegleria gruberi]EFC48680.1 predicted protein [Naegleria gruberi]|eukprot:XP_002681424.1 predicted protein [Naegleria gruberi strain NEG-M]
MFPHSPSKTVMAMIQGGDLKPKSPPPSTLRGLVSNNFENEVQEVTAKFIQSLQVIRNETIEQAKQQIEVERQELEMEKKEWEMEKERLLKMNPIQDEIVYLDVGGKLFTTSIQTLKNCYPILDWKVN